MAILRGARKIDVHLEYHHGNGHADRGWAAVLIRDGHPWAIDGALIGMGHTPDGAVADLWGLARYVVRYGANAMMEHALPLADREWLFAQIHSPGSCDELHEAIHAARKEARRG